MQTEWYEEIINDLKYDDYILIIETYNTMGVRAKDYRLESGGYISSPCEINYVDGLYGKYEKQFFDAASKNDNAVHVYLYEKGKFKEYRQFAKKDYDMFVYQGCKNEALLLNEFGLEPFLEETRAKVRKKLKAAEKFKQSLLYACYIGDTEKIIERAKTASKAQLNKKLDYIGTPLSFCAAHNDLEGFKAVAEAGADLTVNCAGGTVSPLDEAINHSPDIIFYVYENYPEIFKKHFNNWGKISIAECDNLKIYDIMYGLYGTTGMEKLIFALVDKANVMGLKYVVEHGADFTEYRDRYLRYTGFEYAEMRYERNREHYGEVYEILKNAAKGK